MVPEINYWAVLVATASTMVVGTLWYTPRVFGARWMRLTGVDPGQAGVSAVGPIVATVVVSFVTARVLAGATYIAWWFYDTGFLVAALVTGVALWLGFTAARFVTHDAFEGRPVALTTLNVAHELVTVLVMALVLGLWPPSGV
ncbi:DUF1761 domain-containing protein [Xylanimonas protaetiae]|uniref:DUF1761 domain-containing protein n=1 Tax=Xylanimonas protaetiae TaxID=2509457 RepID=A0A4P6F5S1_9MICO|nr:DUF1761 domain-containing protein [Xylanimonas protaetiae]QAY71072.1 DUF1761 domain-containing protein [Xylanimonas protaetiae]